MQINDIKNKVVKFKCESSKKEFCLSKSSAVTACINNELSVTLKANQVLVRVLYSPVD